jgi:predicted transposase YdaD
MAVLRESPWYQEILREGEARGEIRGEVRGIQTCLETLLEIKFGNPGLELMPIIYQITDLQQLKAIQQAIKTVNSVE